APLSDLELDVDRGGLSDRELLLLARELLEAGLLGPDRVDAGLQKRNRVVPRVARERGRSLVGVDVDYRDSDAGHRKACRVGHSSIQGCPELLAPSACAQTEDEQKTPQMPLHDDLLR